MTKIIIAAHGNIAEHLLNAVKNLTGETENIQAINFRTHQSLDDLKNSLDTAVAGKPGEDVFILTDFLGGSPCNCACRLLPGKNMWVVSGVNLPMLLELITKRDKIPPAQLCSEIIKAGRESIVDVKAKFVSQINTKRTCND